MPRLCMRFLGGYQVQLDGEPVVTALEYDKVRALLAYLALEADRAHRREALVGLLWPELPEGRARRNLSQALLTLRRALGDRDAPSFLTVTPHALQFNAASDHWTDVSAFSSLLATCQAHPHWRLETCEACGDRFKRAVELYAGPFLQGLSVPDCPAFEEWQLVWRERLHHEATDALQALACGCAQRGEREAALRYAQGWLTADPWHEGAQRALMRALAQSGRRTEALAQYKTGRRTLREELGADPAPETMALYGAIRDQAALPPPLTPLPNNLPAPATPFLGREPELAQLTLWLRDPERRLVTLLGPGGSGKTRLALQVAAQAVAAASDRYPDGVFFVPLAGLGPGEGIAPALAQALGYRFAPGEDPARSLLRSLRHKRLLLLLDNYEHLLDGSRGGQLCGAGAVAEILGAAPGVEILVTSRARLDVLAENVLLLSGMPCPPTGQDGAEVARYDAAALFLERARALRPAFASQDRALEAVGRICRLVEGMPLALLLAAAWAGVLSPAEIAAGIEERLGFLAADWQGVPERHRSMRAAFDHSWNLLAPRERELFRTISVFRGGFTQEAAREVAGASLHELRSLADKSLLYYTPQGRYEVHELLRQYGVDKLAQAPEVERNARDRHSAHYAAAVERWMAAFKGPRQDEAREEMALEIDNVRAAWEWAAERGHVDALARAMEGLGTFCYWAGLGQEGASAFGRAAAALEPVASGETLRILARLWAWQNYLTKVHGARSELAERCLSLLDHPTLAAPEARRDRAFVLLKVGDVLQDQDTRRGRELCLRGLVLYRELDDRWAIGQAQYVLGIMAWMLGDYEDAEERFQEQLEIARSLDDAMQTFYALSWLARVAYMRGQAEECARWAGECAIQIRGQCNPNLIASGLNTQTLAAHLAGRYAECDAFWEASKAIYGELGYTIIAARMGAWQSIVKVHRGLYEEARSLARSGLEVGLETDTPGVVGLGRYALGCAALAEGQYEQACEQLQESIAAFRRYREQTHAGRALAALGCAVYYLGQQDRACRYLCEALRTALEVGSPLPALDALALAAPLLAGEGQQEHAVELYALARRYPWVAQSRWFEELAGRHVDASAASLPAEVATAARERGRARELWATVTQLLEELGPD
jgi:predicted ATPase